MLPLIWLTAWSTLVRAQSSSGSSSSASSASGSASTSAASGSTPAAAASGTASGSVSSAAGTVAGLSTSFSPTPVTTAVASATAALTNPIEGQGMYPPLQPLCNGGQPDVFCPGMLLQDVQLAGIFPDSKTFPDKPTVANLNSTLQSFATLPENKTIGQIETFVQNQFKGEGLELSQVAITNFTASPESLSNISDPIVKGWLEIVNSYWTLLIRETNQSALCQPGQCESSLIPLNNTIVVPGGRYREIYYWDSFWILEGLLKSELYVYAWDLLSNFMDLIDLYGFLPNGGRKYYLNRSQPPVFVQMVDAYIKVTGNVTVLERALPIMSKELQWWATNRTMSVTSPFTNKTHMVAHYAVNNSAPRPEGYVEDYTTVMGSSPALNESAQADLYAELATGAETGYDYSSRWCKVPIINTTDNNPALRTLNARAIIPVDLNSLLAGDHALLANMYEMYGNMSGSGGNSTMNSTSTGNSTSSNSTSSTNSTSSGNGTDMVQYHRDMSTNFSNAVLDLHWDPSKAWFYDFNTTDNTRSNVYSVAGTFALWQNITPPEVQNNETAALSVVSGLRYLLGRYSGLPSVTTLLYTGLQWDFPNTWPPHAYTSIKAIDALGRAVPNATTLQNLTIPFSNVTSGQFNLDESQLQPQPQSTIGNSTRSLNQAFNLPWPQALAVEYANRYTQAAFCTWYSTGGEISGLLTQLPISELNATGTYTGEQAGVMFEKFNVTDLDAAGGGGEYTTVTGFGWTNGVALWMGSEFGQYIAQPSCPLIPIIEIQGGKNESIYANGTTVPYNGGNSTAGGNSTSGSNSTSANNATRLFVGYRLPRD